MKMLMKGLVSALAIAGAVTAGAANAADKMKVGFVYVGPVSDHGWSYEHDQGRKAVVEKFGDKVETSYVENVAEGPDAERVINKLAADGHDLIFTTSFGFMNPTLKAAKRNGKTKFEHATGYKQAKNVATYSSRFYEGRYVLGKIAGHMTKSNTVGYIASFPIPEVVRGINAAYLAAKSVNPDIEFKIVWVNTWYDPGKEADAAKALIDQGADIIMQHTDSPAPVQVAEERGVYAFGQASDQTHFAPKAHLTAIIDNWAPYYVARVEAAMNGSWKSGNTWGGFNTGMVALAPYNKDIPADVVKLAEDTRKAIEAGTLHPFAGPIVNQAGETVVPAGQSADDGMLAGMSFYVQGITAKLPK